MSVYVCVYFVPMFVRVREHVCVHTCTCSVGVCVCGMRVYACLACVYVFVHAAPLFAPCPAKSAPSAGPLVC